MKPMSAMLRGISVFSGNTILGDGSVILILDPAGLAEAIGMPRKSQGPRAREGATWPARRRRSNCCSCSAPGSPNPKAIPLSLVTRLEEIDATHHQGTWTDCPVVQYRGQLMPLVPASANVKIKSRGTQPVLVFSDDGQRFMGLAVDEIIDIVEERLEIELVSERRELLGSAMIKGQATELVDVRHFLPHAYRASRNRREQAPERTMRRVLLIDDAPFSRNMLAPVIKAAGYAVTVVPSGTEALAAVGSGQQFDCVIADIEMPGLDGLDFTGALRANPRTAPASRYRLVCRALAAGIGARQAGRPASTASPNSIVPRLIAALNERSSRLNGASCGHGRMETLAEYVTVDNRRPVVWAADLRASRTCSFRIA